MLKVKLFYMRNWIVFAGLIFNFLFLSCTHQKQKEFIPEVNTSPNQNPMIEKFDYEAYKNKTLVNSVLKSGNKVIDASFYEDDDTEFICSQTEVSDSLLYNQIIYKQYHRNLNLKSISSYFGWATLVGISEYYNENGDLIQRIDENKKFEEVRITPEKLIELLVEYKIIDSKTSEGIPEQFKSPNKLEIEFFNDSTSRNREKYWIIQNDNKLPNNRIPIGFMIDAQDGLIINWKDEIQPQNLHYLKKYTKK